MKLEKRNVATLYAMASALALALRSGGANEAYAHLGCDFTREEVEELAKLMGAPVKEQVTDDRWGRSLLYSCEAKDRTVTAQGAVPATAEDVARLGVRVYPEPKLVGPEEAAKALGGAR